MARVAWLYLREFWWVGIWLGLPIWLALWCRR